MRRLLLAALVLVGCASDDTETAPPSETGDTGTDTADTDTDTGPDPFADSVVSYAPGETAGFGQDGYPDVVLGSPEGGGNAGSLDVLSLGREGVIVLAFDDIGLIDGPGPDLLVFENPFVGFAETGRVAVSEDGEQWLEWSCEADNPDEGYPGCAGVNNVWATSDNGIDATDPDEAGGDAFDLAALGLERARFVRITDSGANDYAGTSGGFDLDAVAIVNGEAL